MKQKEKDTTEIIDKKKEIAIVVAMAVLFAVLVRVTQMDEIRRIFYLNDECMWKFHTILVVSFFVSIVWFGFFLWIIFEIGRWNTEKYKCFVRNFVIYFIIQFVVLLMVWPGIFKDDEVYVIGYGIANLHVKWEQSFITQLHYLIALTILPYVVSITLIQITVISIIEAKIMEKIHSIIENKKYAYFMLVIFLLFPVLDNNQFNLRNSIICWIFLFIVINVYSEYKRFHAFSGKCIYLTMFLSVFIGVWKTEFLYTVPCFGLIFWLNREKNKKNIVHLFYSLVMICAAYFVLTIPNRFFEPDNNYIISAVFTPVCQIVTEHYDEYDHEIIEEITVIDKFIPLEIIKEENSGVNLPYSFWHAEVLPKQDKAELLKACVKICFHYWQDFLKNRVKVYAWTNGLVPDVINHNASIGGDAHDVDVDGQDLYNYHFKYTNLVDPNFRGMVIRLLACRTKAYYYQTNIFYPILYNSFIGVIFICFLLIVYLVKKEWINVQLMFVILLQVPLIFLMAPAGFFMYYMPFYLTSAGVMMLSVIETIDRKSSLKQLH